MKKNFFHIFHPPAHPPNPRHISALGLKIKNRKREPESMIVMCTHAKFQAIWSSRCCWGFFWFEKSSPRVLIQGCLYSRNIRWALSHPGSFEREWKTLSHNVKYSEEYSRSKPQNFFEYYKFDKNSRIFLGKREASFPLPTVRNKPDFFH